MYDNKKKFTKINEKLVFYLNLCAQHRCSIYYHSYTIHRKSSFNFFFWISIIFLIQNYFTRDIAKVVLTRQIVFYNNIFKVFLLLFSVKFVRQCSREGQLTVFVVMLAAVGGYAKMKNTPTKFFLSIIMSIITDTVIRILMFLNFML